MAESDPSHPRGTHGDPFEVLGLEPRFDLAAGEIQRAYLAAIRGAHPDAAGSGVSDPDPANDPTVINAARATLQSPERRASALLAKLGGPGASEVKDLPDGFLMEMMTTRQEMEEAFAEAKNAEAKNAGAKNAGAKNAGTGAVESVRTEWDAWATADRSARLDSIASLFSADAPDLTAIRVELNALRYIERMLEQLDPDYDHPNGDHAPASERL